MGAPQWQRSEVGLFSGIFDPAREELVLERHDARAPERVVGVPIADRRAGAPILQLLGRLALRSPALLFGVRRRDNGAPGRLPPLEYELFFVLRGLVAQRG